jgi:hypothetical protein
MKEAVQRSVTADGTQLSLLQFNDQQESFRELHRDFNKLAATNVEAAERLKETRLAAILLGLPKTSLRFVEGDFFTTYLEERLPDALKAPAPQASAVEIPGLPGVVIEDDGDATRSARALTDRLLQARTQTLAGAPSVAAEAGMLLKSADEVFRTATRRAGADSTLRKKQTAVPEQVSEAADCLVQAAREFARSRAERTLDLDAFDAALLELRDGLEQLARQGARSEPEDQGEGVAWLLNTVRGV